MAKIYNDPKCKLCRREGVKLFLKGARCLSEKCAIVKHNQLPGHKGRRLRQSSYGEHLREKQKVKRIYNVSERQFRNYYKEAKKLPGVTGSYLLQLLERRFDNVVYRLGFASSKRQARNFIRQGKFTINGKMVTYPSVLVSSGDVVAIGNPKGIVVLEDRESTPWLSLSKDKKQGKVLRLPEREDIDPEIKEQLIVEFYSM